MKIQDEIIANPITRIVQDLFENQTAKGIAKYGHTVDVKEYSVTGWGNHASMEIIDLLVYIQCLVNSAEKVKRENERLIKTVRFYAQEGSWSYRDDERMYKPSDVELDKGNKARKVLEELGYESY